MYVSFTVSSRNIGELQVVIEPNYTNKSGDDKSAWGKIKHCFVCVCCVGGRVIKRET